MNYSELDLAILKAITTNKKQAIDFVNDYSINILSPDVWNFANLVVGYIKTYKDIPTHKILQDKASQVNSNFVDVVNTIWNKLETVKTNEKEFVFNLEKVKQRFTAEEISKLKNKLEKSDTNAQSIQDLERTIKNIKTLSSTKTYDSKSIQDYVAIFTEKYNAKKINPNLENKIKIGYSFFDYATNGVGAADFVIVAGESGFGKSLMLNNMGVQTWLQNNTIDSSIFSEGKNVVYFSLEMPYEDCFNRLLSRLAGVPSRKIENATLNKEEFNKIKVALEFIKKYPYKFEIVDIQNASATDLETILNDLQFEVDVIFIDYLGIMKTNDRSDEQDWLKQGEIAYEVRAIGRKYNLPIFTAVQLNRKAPTKDPSEAIGLGRLARSSTIATHATTVIQIESRPNEENYPDFIYHIIKNRKGPKGKGRLLKNLPCATLLDIQTDNSNIQNNIEVEFPDTDDISGDIELFDI